MKVNTTIITEQANKSGRFCGASGCHDGKVSFGHEDKASCEKCHNGLIDYGTEKFDKLANAPFAPFGNRIDWVESLHTGVIAPLNHLKNRPKEITLNKTLSLEAEWNFVPTSVFSHKIHTEWLDCNNCHPEIFSIKKKGTEDFSMANILKGEFCGVCHLTVAFPINDCKRCHPGMKNGI
jgi:c(7)-type cytochrome triheme protein